MQVPVSPGRNPVTGQSAPAFTMQVPDYPMVLAFLRTWQGKTLVESAFRLWPIWAGIIAWPSRLGNLF